MEYMLEGDKSHSAKLHHVIFWTMVGQHDFVAQLLSNFAFDTISSTSPCYP